MTQKEIKDYIRYFTNVDLDIFFGEDATDSQIYSLINWAIRTFSILTWCNYDDRITFTLTADQAVYDLRNLAVVNKKIIYPRRIILNGIILRSPNGDPGLWSLSDLESQFPGYHAYSSGTPARGVFLPNYRLLLSPPPNAAIASKTNYISGVYLAPDMAIDGTDANNSPDIPVEWHEILAFFAAVKAAMPSATESSALTRLTLYNNEWKERLLDYARTNRNLIMGNSYIQQSNDYLYI